jgi:hypothetical protein
MKEINISHLKATNLISKMEAYRLLVCFKVARHIHTVDRMEILREDGVIITTTIANFSIDELEKYLLKKDNKYIKLIPKLRELRSKYPNNMPNTTDVWKYDVEHPRFGKYNKKWRAHIRRCRQAEFLKKWKRWSKDYQWIK